MVVVVVGGGVDVVFFERWAGEVFPGLAEGFCLDCCAGEGDGRCLADGGEELRCLVFFGGGGGGGGLLVLVLVLVMF